jgi:DNA-directed RNA polymerase specialized sigma24 family protein
MSSGSSSSKRSGSSEPIGTSESGDPTEHLTGSEFHTTQWSMVLAAADNGEVLDGLIRTYWGPIYAYIRRSGNSPDRAMDLTQEFLAKLLDERSLIQRADPRLGRFRTFLKASLHNFLVDSHRRATTLARKPAGALLGQAALDDYEPSTDDDPSGAFDRQWATTLMALTIARVRAECERNGQKVHWEIFNTAVIEPQVRQARPTMAEVAAANGIDGADRVASMIQTVRRQFRRTLRLVILETVSDPVEAHDEIEKLRAFLRV